MAVPNQPFDEAFDIDDASDIASVLGGPSPQPPRRSQQQEFGSLSGSAMDRGNTPPRAPTPDDESSYMDDGEGQLEMGDYGHNSFRDTGSPGLGSIESSSDAGSRELKMEGAYDPAEYAHLPVGADIKELFELISNFQPEVPELETKLRPFIPDYIPAVGDIDAMIKIPRVDKRETGLGLDVLDEPCAGQSDATVLDLQLRSISKTATARAVTVKQVEDAERNPKPVESWIASITELHRQKPPQSVHYSSPMPNIESLMQEWPAEFEDLLSKTDLPSAKLNVTLKDYVAIVCGLLDIPVHKSRIESLHVLFSLYAEFKNSQHFGGADETDTAINQDDRGEAAIV